MVKFLINIFLIYQLLFIVLNQSNIQDISEIEEQYKKEYIKEFKKNVKEYLTRKKLNENSRISKNVFKKIFKEIMMHGMELPFKDIEDIYDKVSEEFAKDAFPKGVQHIKGSEIEKYLDYDNIMDKFNKYAKANPYNNKGDL